jgi:protease I
VHLKEVLMPARLDGKRIAFLATNGVEEVELTGPWKAARDAGAATELVSTKPGRIYAMHHDDKGDSFDVDRTTADARVDDYDALVIPGGVASPDRLRLDDAAVRLVRSFVESGKPVAAVCHGPWMLVEADVVEGRTITSWPSLETDIENAGGTWVDEQVHVDQGIVTSRRPDDLQAFCSKLIEEVVEGRHEGRVRMPTGSAR